jgi:hypothetical protein
MNKERYNQIIDEVYLNYSKNHFKIWEPGMDYESKESFIRKCKTNPEFSEKWGLTIEERKLSLEERYNLIEEDKHTQFVNWQSLGTDRVKEVLDELNIPTKLITITHNNETIESYE